MTYRHVGPSPDELPSLKEKREISVEYLQKELGMTRKIVFGCDECDAVETCEFAFDPYNIDGDCLAEK